MIKFPPKFSIPAKVKALFFKKKTNSIFSSNADICIYSFLSILYWYFKVLDAFEEKLIYFKQLFLKPNTIPSASAHEFLKIIRQKTLTR